MKRIERLLVAANMLLALLAGWQGLPLLLGLPLVGFAGYVLVADRSLRTRIGQRHWPSAGFARFTLGSNLYLTVWNMGLAALLFALAGTVHALALPLAT